MKLNRRQQLILGLAMLAASALVGAYPLVGGRGTVIMAFSAIGLLIMAHSVEF